jgi:DNA-binding response OmpR family regulator
MNTNPIWETEKASTATPGGNNALPRILVVDDDDDSRRFNAEVLINSGYQVDAAADGAAGWEALNSSHYDLLITDNRMPKLTGIELVKKLRAARMELPVIMATGTPPEHEYERRPWLIPEATLVKPYTVEELLASVNLILARTTFPSKDPSGNTPS